MNLNRIRNFFGKNDEGSVSVEFAIWTPAFLGVILLGADTSVSFSRQSNYWNVAYETARIVSRHGMGSDDAALHAQGEMEIGSYRPEVAVKIDEATQVVTVTVTAEAAEMAPFGILARALGETVSISVSKALEPS
jgi:Flp pilus assembly protein TadG